MINTNVTQERERIAVLPNMPLMPPLLQESEFINYTFQWNNMINAGHSRFFSISQYFYSIALLGQSADPSFTTGINFTDDSIQYLISSPGVQTIKARFALYPTRTDGTAGLFTIILYGVDSQGNRCSAYYLGQPNNVTIGDPNNGIGNISSILALNWISNWAEFNNNQNEDGITSELFYTSVGYLNGYNYKMSDFMGLLYPLNRDIEEYTLNVVLGLHQHHSLAGTDTIVNTFGLVLVGQAASGTDEPNSFYDLSTPSPPAP